jgi:hypothetical protein
MGCVVFLNLNTVFLEDLPVRLMYLGEICGLTAVACSFASAPTYPSLAQNISACGNTDVGIVECTVRLAINIQVGERKNDLRLVSSQLPVFVLLLL